MRNEFDFNADKHEQTAKSAAQTNKVWDLFTDKPYAKRYELANTGAKFIAFICNLVSLATFSFLIGYLSYSLLIPAVGENVAAGAGVLIGTVTAILFELIKVAAYTNFLIQFYKFKNVSFAGLAAVALLSTLSVSSSFVGAKLLPAVTLADTTKADYSYYDNTKSELLKQVASAQKGSTYKGIITKDGQKQIAQIHKQIQANDDARAAAAAAAAADKQSFEADKQSITAYLGYFSIASELVFIACYLFSFYYLYRCYIELKISNSTDADFIPMQLKQYHSTTNTQAAPPVMPMQTTPPAVPLQPAAAPPAVPLQPNKIGFIYGLQPKDSQPADSQPADSQPADSVVSKYGIGTCGNCSTKFHKNSYNHKYCSDNCKLDYHEKKHGARFIPRKK